MNKRVVYIFTTLFLCLVLSCTEKKRYYGGYVNETPIEIDTAALKQKVHEDVDRQLKAAEATRVTETTKPKTKSAVSNSTSSCQSHGSDNMRGWDPPSEDDMDDNGMSRYMENNDEEGWY